MHICKLYANYTKGQNIALNPSWITTDISCWNNISHVTKQRSRLKIMLKGAEGALVYLWEATLLLLGRQEEADHPQQLQVAGGHLHLAQRLVEQVDGQVEGVGLETHDVLVDKTNAHSEGPTQPIQS